jgi:hypothetical protein
MDKVSVSNIFYKDGKTFFVPLREDQLHKKFKRSFGSLGYEDAKAMIALREKEKYVLAIQAGNRNLAYYQPDTTETGGRLQEGLVLFNMTVPQKNYNHIPENRPGYHHIMEQHGTDFVDFARSASRRRLEGKLVFKPVANNRQVAVLSSIPTVITPASYSDVVRNFLEQTGKTLEDFGGDVSEYIDPQ